jgi:pimeloyl-ACP methyl ester carboxylesterase
VRVPRAVISAALVLSGCGMHREPVVAPPGVQVVRSIVLHGHTVRVHVADTRQSNGTVRPLLVYATGDRGWAGKDLDVYRHLVAWGYPVAGFDAHDYVKHLGPASTTTPAGLAADYGAIITAARDALGMYDDDPVVLVGVSRGADLSVVAAGTRLLRARLSGVVAVALTREEEYVKWFGRRLRRARANAEKGTDGSGSEDTPQMVELYEYLPLLRELPITVIQSTNDNYLPAAQARVLFGPDTAVRHFVAIQARNHSFAGARDRLYDAMRTALDRIAR